MLLNIKQTQKIMETVYGKVEKILISKISKSVKKIIEIRQLEVKIILMKYH